ncbi:MAG: heparinase II/III-family protein, partial [Gemmatimonadota bacterium]|nr:heparinase II/III-family protein [Gemmatimonadota bacterium]
VLSAQPDGSIPMVSDVGPRKSYISSMQEQGRELFPENPLFKYPVGVQETVVIEPPEVASYRFKWAGYGIMRQDWTRNSQYLLFDMGFYGTNHQHEDKLNIILYAYGRELLHDPGIYRYSNDGFERYFRGSRGHNLILVDGKGQRTDMFFDKGDPYNRVSFPDAGSRWIDRKKYILARGAYRLGFAEKLLPLWGGKRELRSQEQASLVHVEHSRKILWLKGEYWVMADLLTGEGTHRLEQVFHFSPVLKEHSAEGVEPGTVILKGNKVALSRNPGVANIAVMQVGGEDLEVRRQKGEKDPHAGWTSLYGEIPAWDVTFEAKRKLPAAFYTVLLPLKPGEAGEKNLPDVKTLRQDAQAAVFDLIFTGRTDRVIITAGEDGRKINFPGGDFEGEALILRKLKGGTFQPLLHEGGISLVLDGREISLPDND